jgi:hypothetical protein
MSRHPHNKTDTSSKYETDVPSLITFLSLNEGLKSQTYLKAKGEQFFRQFVCSFDQITQFKLYSKCCMQVKIQTFHYTYGL